MLHLDYGATKNFEKFVTPNYPLSGAVFISFFLLILITHHVTPRIEAASSWKEFWKREGLADCHHDSEVSGSCTEVTNSVELGWNVRRSVKVRLEPEPELFPNCIWGVRRT